MRTNEGIKRPVRVAPHRGDIDAVVNVFHEAIRCSVMNAEFISDEGRKRDRRCYIQHSEIRLFGSSRRQSACEVECVEAIAIGSSTMRALVSGGIQCFKIRAQQVRTV